MTASPRSAPAPAPTVSTSSYGNCPPAWSTPRTPDRRTIGDRTARLAAAAGIRFDGWQTDVAQVIGEVDDAGRLVYPLVVLIVPRRAGKTLLDLFHMLSVIIGGPRRRAWYTMHRREIGAALWRDEIFPMLGESRLSPLLSLRRSNGSEAVTVRRLSSTLRLFAPSGEALRSQNADVVTVDEAREFTIEQGDRLEAAVRPAQARRASRQLIVVSSAPGPDAAAEYLAGYRDIGRAAVDAGRREGVAYFEWQAPRHLAWDDPATWALGHPALAAGQITPDALLPDLEKMPAAVFQAEYLGWWWDDPADARTIGVEQWARCATPATLAELTRPVVGVDITFDRARAAVTVAGTLPDSRVHVELVALGAGATWALDTAVTLARSVRGSRIVVDDYGPTANLIDPARQRLGEARVVTLATGEAAMACATMLDLVNEGRLSHRDQPELNDVVGAGRARPRGDGWLWDRKVTGPELIAATWAAYVAALPAPMRPLVAYSR